MAMPKPVPNEKTNVRNSVDTVLLTTLLNKELKADARVFNIKMEYIPASQIWQIWVEHFKNTFLTVQPEDLYKHADMLKLAKKMALKLLSVMSQQPKEAKIGNQKEEKKNESVPA